MTRRASSESAPRARSRAVELLAAALFCCVSPRGAGGAGAPTSTLPSPHPPPLPTAAVDAKLFPTNAPARHSTPGPLFVVAPSGDDASAGSAAAPFRTIARGIRAATAPRSHVLVHAGTYAEGDAQDQRALVIETEGTVVDTPPAEHVTVRPGAPSVTYGLEIRASHVTVSGISFDGFAANGVSIGVDDRTTADVVFSDAEVTMPKGGDGIAIYLDGRAAGRCVVDGLLVERVSVIGADQGITVSNGPVRSVALTSVVVRNRAVGSGNSGSDCVGFESADNVLVNGAEMSGGDADGIDLKATRAAVVNAYVHDLAGNGVKLWHGGDIVNTLVHDCGADASVVLDGAGRYRIVETLVAFHNRRSGAAAYVLTCGYDHARDPIDLELTDCVFYRNAGGLATSVGTRALIRGSLFFGARNHSVIDYAWDGSTSKTITDSAPASSLALLATATANLAFSTDPRLADPSSTTLGGFRPSAASPLRGAGLAPAPFPTVDLTGAARRRARQPDVGPLEGR